MIIQEKTYKNICYALSGSQLESCGLLGGSHDVISKFYFDRGAVCDEKSCIPDTDILTIILEKWYLLGIEWLGIVHSHKKNKTPSEPDLFYAKKILNYKMKNGWGEKFILGIYVMQRECLFLYRLTSQESLLLYKEISYSVLKEMGKFETKK